MEANVVSSKRHTLYNSASDGSNDNREAKSQKPFVERTALEGAEKIRSISIEERTKRAMMAEAVEDRVLELSDELDQLLGDDGMPLKKEYREKIETLAKEIKASREQYRVLVSGEDCSMINLLESLK